MKLLGVFYVLFVCQILCIHAQIAVVYSLEADAKVLRDQAPQTITPASLREKGISKTQIGEHDVYLIQAGSGTELSASRTTKILENTHPQWLIHLGPAGALGENTPNQTFEITSVVPHQHGTLNDQGQQPGEETLLTKKTNLPGNTLASGNSFINNTQAKTTLAAKTNAQLVDMNSQGVLIAQKESSVPEENTVILKVVSDQANEEAGPEFREFANSYQGDLAKLLIPWIQSLPPDPSNAKNLPNLAEILDQNEEKIPEEEK